MVRLAIVSLLSIMPLTFCTTPSGAEVREVLAGFFGVNHMQVCESWVQKLWSPAGTLHRDNANFVGQHELVKYCKSWQSEQYVHPTWSVGAFTPGFEQSGPYLYVEGKEFFALLVPFVRSLPATDSAAVITETGRISMKLSPGAQGWKIAEAVELQASTTNASQLVDSLWDSFFSLPSIPSCTTWGELWSVAGGVGGYSWVTPQETLAGIKAMTGFCSSNQDGDKKYKVNGANAYMSTYRQDGSTWVTKSNASLFSLAPGLYSALSQSADGSFSIYSSTSLEMAQVERRSGAVKFNQIVEFQTAYNQKRFESEAVQGHVFV